MRERGFASAGTTVVLAAIAAILVAPLFMNWIVVDVRTAPPDNVRIKLPVPLAVVRTALWFVPADEVDATLPAEVAAQRESVLAAFRALESSPDTVFLSVRSREGTVRLAKERGRLVLDVDHEEARVHAVLPIEAAHRILARWDWRDIDPQMAVDFLAAAERGQLLSVDSEEATVRIAKW
ncbi:MAG: hypothetical protein AB1625_16240 [Acidobacteriota bacterium]